MMADIAAIILIATPILISELNFNYKLDKFENELRTSKSRFKEESSTQDESNIKKH